MPELWVPYGSVEILVTIQAENLGAVCEPGREGDGTYNLEEMKELARRSAQIFVCDSAPATVEVIRGLLPALEEAAAPRVISSAPRKIEGEIPELKGKVVTLPPPLSSADGDEPVYATELTAAGAKLFVGTARPDPFFGILDSKVEAVLNWIARSRVSAAGASPGMEPTPFRKTDPYEAAMSMAERIPDSNFVTVVPRGGKPRDAMVDPPFDAVKNAFPVAEAPQSKGVVVGAGGRGYDDTFSSALRGLWSATGGVRKTGSILLVAECSEGIGSTALEMLVTGQITRADDRRRKYVDGLEEIFYLNKLKEEHDVLLLSGLPETYARAKLGVATAKGSGEAVGRVLNRVGRSGKLNLIPRAPECRVVSG